MAKKELTISEFREIIREEALKLKKKMVLENEKKNLQNELKKLINESFMGEEMGEEIEEGLGDFIKKTFNTTQGGQDSFLNDLKTKQKNAMYMIGRVISPEEISGITSQAKADNYGGKLEYTGKGSGHKLVYINSNDAKSSSGPVQGN